VIVPQKPEIVFYEKHPLLGTLFNTAAGDSFRLFGEEVTLRLFPLFVADSTRPTYVWEVGGKGVEPEDSGRELTLRKTGTGTGKFLVGASLETPNSLYEHAENKTYIIF